MYEDSQDFLPVVILLIIVVALALRTRFVECNPAEEPTVDRALP